MDLNALRLSKEEGGKLGRLKGAISHRSPKQLEAVEHAFRLAAWAHRGQKRLNGNDYFEHPYMAATRAAEKNLDPDSVISLLLHDAPEEQTPKQYRERGENAITIELIRRKFGNTVAENVFRMTKPRWDGKSESWIFSHDKRFYELPLECPEERRAEREALHIEKVFSGGSGRVAILKYFDVLHNAQTLSGPRISDSHKKRFFKRYVAHFHLLARVVSKEFYERGISYLRRAGFQIEPERPKQASFYSAPRRSLFPDFDLLEKLPPVGENGPPAPILYDKEPSGRYVMELPKSLSVEESARILKEELGLVGIKRIKSLLPGTLSNSAGFLFSFKLPSGRETDQLIRLHKRLKLAYPKYYAPKRSE